MSAGVQRRTVSADLENSYSTFIQHCNVSKPATGAQTKGESGPKPSYDASAASEPDAAEAPESS